MLQRAVMAVARTRSIAKDLSSIHIRTMLHTHIRWDKGRRFKPNDLMDIEHAQTALPHCTHFLTDALNAHLIRTSGLDVTYGCIVTGSPTEALEIVRSL